MKIKFSLIVIIIILTSQLSGCYDATEIDDEIYALVIGVDKGINNKIILTIQYPIYQSGGGGGEKGKESKGGDKAKSSGGDSEKSNELPGSHVASIEASSILEGLDMFGMCISRRVSLMHTKALVFSEDFAKTGIGNYLAPIARFRDTRRTMSVFVTTGTAQDFIKEDKPDIGESLAKSLELLLTQADSTSYFSRIKFNDFYRATISPYESSICGYASVNNFENFQKNKENATTTFDVNEGFKPGKLPRQGVVKREFVGSAVFDGDKMVGSLDSYETRYLQIVKGIFTKGIITMNDALLPGSVIPIDVRMSRKPQINTTVENNKAVITVTLKLEGDVSAIQSRINYEDIKLLPNLENQIKQQIQTGILKIIERSQKELKADIFGFGHKIAGNFATIQEFEKYDWHSQYPEAKVNVNLEFNIRRTGIIIRSSPIIACLGLKASKGVN